MSDYIRLLYGSPQTESLYMNALLFILDCILKLTDINLGISLIKYFRQCAHVYAIYTPRHEKSVFTVSKTGYRLKIPTQGTGRETKGNKPQKW